ncbi:hypothetical protein B0H11DRAFT_2378408 [Mycena galericulata]|nr:hypothetical protein B0H11DRAFT_2378408 [Mycena galericulata]
MAPVSLLSANLAVVVLGSLLYGVYATLSSSALYLLVTRTRNRDHRDKSSTGPRLKIPSPIAFGVLTLFITVTAHWLLNVARLFIAFHQWEDGPGPLNFYSDFSHITEVLKYGFFVASFVIGDILVIHRLWTVWAFRTRMIIVPGITLMGFTAFGVGLTYQLSTYNSSESIFKGAFRRWTTGICFLSVCTVTYTTGFIWYKLWNTGRMLKSLGITSLSPIIEIFIDSAALIAVWGVFHIVSSQLGSNIQFIAIDCIPVIGGVSNMLIHIRLHIDLTQTCPGAMSLPTNPMMFATEVEDRQSEAELATEIKGNHPSFDV